MEIPNFSNHSVPHHCHQLKNHLKLNATDKNSILTTKTWDSLLSVIRLKLLFTQSLHNDHDQRERDRDSLSISSLSLSLYHRSPDWFDAILQPLPFLRLQILMAFSLSPFLAVFLLYWIFHHQCRLVLDVSTSATPICLVFYLYKRHLSSVISRTS